ncbi:MAG: hypothetical protein JHD02_03795 [Thermoleophilaceae bacterium]|nr:hypothetical protein [Thermoleophilaceae bacterium]
MIARCRSLKLLLVVLATAASLLGMHGTAAAAVPAFGFDPSFGTNGVGLGHSSSSDGYFVVNAVAPRPEGGWIAVGYMGGKSDEEDYDSDWNWMVSAFRADGSPDTQFGSNGRLINSDPGGYGKSYGSTADAVTVQPDGKILVGGIVDVSTSSDQADYLDQVGGDPECNCFAGRGAFRIARYLADGKLDRGFGARGHVLLRGLSRSWTENGAMSSLEQIVVGRGGRIYVLGETMYFSNGLNASSNDRQRLIGFAVNKNGTTRRSFGRNGRLLAAVGRRTADFHPERAVELRSGELVVSGYTLLGRGAATKRFRVATVRVTRRGRLDNSAWGRGWREISFAPKKYDFAAVDMRADGSAVYLLTRHIKSSYSGPTGRGAVVASVKPSGYRDTEFATAGVLNLSEAVGPEVRDGNFIAALRDGSMAVLVNNGLRQKYSDDPDPHRQSLIAISKHGIDGPALQFEIPSTSDQGFDSRLMSTDGSRVVLGGTVTAGESDRVFFARLRHVGN